jgi:hypothetical protein
MRLTGQSRNFFPTQKHTMLACLVFPTIAGDVVLSHGAQAGCYGYPLSNGSRINSFPAFWPTLYQPDRPVGQRTTILQATPVARMYHSHVRLLTPVDFGLSG